MDGWWPLVFLVCLFHHGTSALQVSWGEGDQDSNILICFSLGRTLSCGWELGVQNPPLHTHTPLVHSHRNFTSSPLSWRGWEMLASYPSWWDMITCGWGLRTEEPILLGLWGWTQLSLGEEAVGGWNISDYYCRILIDFLEWMSLHLLYALRTVSLEMKCSDVLVVLAHLLVSPWKGLVYIGQATI